jgi:hypothetical protein
LDFPFFYLNPELSKTPGGKWWNRRLKWLLERFAGKGLARSILCVEYFPYHSRGFGFKDLPLESQEYGFNLVRSAIHRGAVIVIMRGEKHWTRKLKELRGHSRVLRLKNWRNVVLSPRNLKGRGFQKMVSAICENL